MHRTTRAAAAHRDAEASADAAPRQPWSLLILLCVAQFMVVLDMTVANVALPSIGADLDFAAGDLQWVITSYLLFTGGLLLLGGRIADVVGHRRVFLTGLLIFTAASLASGLASSPATLIAARAAQGFGAAPADPRRARHHHGDLHRYTAHDRAQHLGRDRRRRRRCRRRPRRDSHDLAQLGMGVPRQRPRGTGGRRACIAHRPVCATGPRRSRAGRPARRAGLSAAMH
jgi:hypothetical protein